MRHISHTVPLVQSQAIFRQVSHPRFYSLVPRLRLHFLCAVRHLYIFLPASPSRLYCVLRVNTSHISSEGHAFYLHFPTSCHYSSPGFTTFRFNVSSSRASFSSTFSCSSFLSFWFILFISKRLVSDSAFTSRVLAGVAVVISHDALVQHDVRRLWCNITTVWWQEQRLRQCSKHHYTNTTSSSKHSVTKEIQIMAKNNKGLATPATVLFKCQHSADVVPASHLIRPSQSFWSDACPVFRTTCD